MILDKSGLDEIGRYIANGLLATAVHFGVLTFNLEVIEMPSAGAASIVAAVFGIACSFLGSRFFVFRNHTGRIASQAAMFLGLYFLIAILHGGVLYAWTDLANQNYRSGFLLATLIQVAISYIGNRTLVFKE